VIVAKDEEEAIIANDSEFGREPLCLPGTRIVVKNCRRKIGGWCLLCKFFSEIRSQSASLAA
jgi:hypothetical protein